MNYLNTPKLAKLVRLKRGSTGLRDTAEEIGNISPATLSRVENGNLPDMLTFIALCNWLDIHPGELFLSDDQSSHSPQELTTVDEITGILLTDKKLDPTSASILTRIITAAYYELIA